MWPVGQGISHLFELNLHIVFIAGNLVPRGDASTCHMAAGMQAIGILAIQESGTNLHYNPKEFLLRSPCRNNHHLLRTLVPEDFKHGYRYTALSVLETDTVTDKLV